MTRSPQPRHRATPAPAGYVPISLRRSATSAVGLACVGLLSWTIVVAAPAPGALAAEFTPMSPGIPVPPRPTIEFTPLAPLVPNGTLGVAPIDAPTESRPILGFADPSGLDSSWVGSGTNATATPTAQSPVQETRDPSGLDGWAGAEPSADRTPTQTLPNLGYADPSGLGTTFVGPGGAGQLTMPEGISFQVVGGVAGAGGGGRIYVGREGVAYSEINDRVGSRMDATISTAGALPANGRSTESGTSLPLGVAGRLGGVDLAWGQETVAATGVTTVSGSASVLRWSVGAGVDPLGAITPSLAYSIPLGFTYRSAIWESDVTTTSIPWSEVPSRLPNPTLYGVPDPSGLDTTFVNAVPAPPEPEASIPGYVDGSQGLIPAATVTPAESVPESGATTVPDLGQAPAAVPAESTSPQATTASDPTITASSPAASTLPATEESVGTEVDTSSEAYADANSDTSTQANADLSADTSADSESSFGSDTSSDSSFSSDSSADASSGSDTGTGSDSGSDSGYSSSGSDSGSY